MKWTALDWIDYLIMVAMMGFFCYYTETDMFQNWQPWIMAVLIFVTRQLRSEASKVVGRLKSDLQTIQQLKEELARKEEQVRSLKYWVEQNKFEQYADSKGREIVNAFDLTEELDLILAPKDR